MDWFLFPIKLHPVDSGIGRGLGMLPTSAPKTLGSVAGLSGILGRLCPNRMTPRQAEFTHMWARLCL